jgi:aldehyde:ferredoxin oxidoreductase
VFAGRSSLQGIAGTRHLCLEEGTHASDLWLACSHVSQVERDFNLREGLQRKDDTLPDRFKDHPIPDGPAAGTTINIDHLVDDYYDVKGWDK